MRQTTYEHTYFTDWICHSTVGKHQETAHSVVRLSLQFT